MLQRLLLLLVFLPVAGHAETNACLPVTNQISAPGAYCLQADWYPVPGYEDLAIDISYASDVTLDCNGYRIVGAVVPPDQVATAMPAVGINIGTSSRVTVRNCHVVGFTEGIFVGRAANGQPRSRDITIEDNVVSDSVKGILFSGEGNNRIRNNLVTDARVRAIEAYAPPGQVTVSNNAALRAGDTSYNTGSGGLFNSSLGGWMIVEGNVFTEVVAPTGTTGAAAVDLGTAGGIGVMFTGNRILAPANPAEKGAVTVGIANGAGNGCEGNLVVGYGTAPIPNCTVPTNEQR
jgi:parallel beta-helix repeat protein